MDRTQQQQHGTPPLDLIDFDDSPIAGGADFACSWSGANNGHMVVNAGVLHASTSEQSAVIPREQLRGWTVRHEGGVADLTLEGDDDLQLRVPLPLMPVVEKALTRLQNG